MCSADNSPTAQPRSASSVATSAPVNGFTATAGKFPISSGMISAVGAQHCCAPAWQGVNLQALRVESYRSPRRMPFGTHRRVTAPKSSPPPAPQSLPRVQPRPHPHSSSPSNESFPSARPAPAPAPPASSENAAPASVFPKSPPRQHAQSQNSSRPATSSHAPKKSNCSHPSTSDRYPENASRYLPAPPPPTTHRKAHAPAHPHPDRKSTRLNSSHT